MYCWTSFNKIILIGLEGVFLRIDNKKTMSKIIFILVGAVVCVGSVFAINELRLKSEQKQTMAQANINTDILTNNDLEKQTTTTVEQTVKVQPKGEQKTLFLTFDDGPSVENTPKVIDILKRYNVKATFFVVGKYAKDHPEMVRQLIDNGFQVENHTYTHDYNYEYSSPKNLVNDFKQNEQLLKSIIPGYSSKIVRFPAGSRQRDQSYKDAVRKAGFEFVDWNCLSNDSMNESYTPEDLLNNIKETEKGKKFLVVLNHDSAQRQNTVQALPAMIEHFQSENYVFKTLDEDPVWREMK